MGNRQDHHGWWRVCVLLVISLSSPAASPTAHTAGPWNIPRARTAGAAQGLGTESRRLGRGMGLQAGHQVRNSCQKKIQAATGHVLLHLWLYRRMGQCDEWVLVKT